MRILLVSTLLLSVPAFAGDGRLRCRIFERAHGQKIQYEIEEISKPNHTVYYYAPARLATRYYVRASGMVGGGAVYLHVNLEDTSTKINSLTKGEQSGKLWMGTNQELVELECSTTLDRR